MMNQICFCDLIDTCMLVLDEYILKNKLVWYFSINASLSTTSCHMLIWQCFIAFELSSIMFD